MYIDCNDKTQREAVRDAVRIAVGKMKETNKATTEVQFELLVCIDAVMERQEEIIEDQEERIAIMSEGGWHDAEKDPPKETDCYIVRIDYGVGQMTTMREYISSEGKWLMSIEEKITHWMPMPKPPKEGDVDG